ncbi:hypothetical protein RSSE_c2822 [Ralstonia solanacearum]|nr:hypothetical protein RSSE_c2822 [Ralstonia solanacearum]
MAHFFAILNDDAGFRLIDVHAQQPGRRTFHFHQLITHSGEGFFNQISQMHVFPEEFPGAANLPKQKKMGAMPISFAHLLQDDF